jgi:hypothetical protein
MPIAAIEDRAALHQSAQPAVPLLTEERRSGNNDVQTIRHIDTAKREHRDLRIPSLPMRACPATVRMESD